MADKYFYALGRRKTAVATVRLFNKTGTSQVNGKKLSDIYSDNVSKVQIEEPFRVAELEVKDFYFTAKTQGGGKSAQLGAIRLALSRAIVKMDESKKSLLKKAGLLTRDPRMVERKKPGLHKARKAEQYSKR
ncbi:MAG: 30S ribosomal protein S9 [Candidatus Dojkabacteria bacterium]